MGRSRSKQLRPHRLLPLRVAADLPKLASSFDAFVEDVEAEPQTTPQRQRARRKVQVRTTADVCNSPRTLEHSLSEVVFAAPCHVFSEVYSSWRVTAEVTEAGPQADTALVCISASKPEMLVPELQVLVHVPTRQAALSFIKLLEAQRLCLSLTPCTNPIDLLDKATQPAKPRQHPDIITAVTARPEPATLASVPLSHSTRQAAAGEQHTATEPQQSATLPLEHVVGPAAAQLTLHQGVDVVCAAPVPPAQLHTATTTSSAPVVPGLLLDDSLPWTCSQLLSCRLSALLLNTAPTAAQPADTTPAPAPQSASTEAAAAQPANAAQVLLPSGEDAMWSLTVQLPTSAWSDVMAGTELDGVSQAQGSMQDAEVTHLLDPESEERSDDMLRVLRWLLPHHFAAYDPIPPAWQQQHSHSQPPPPLVPSQQPQPHSSHSQPSQLQQDSPPQAAQLAQQRLSTHPGSPHSPPASPTASPISPRRTLSSPRNSLPGTHHAPNTPSVHFSAAALYNLVKPTGQEPEFTEPVPALKPELRPYQRRAVAWMLSREQGTGQDSHNEPQPCAGPVESSVVPSAVSSRARRKTVRHVAPGGSCRAVDVREVRPHLLHPLWRRLVTLGGKDLFVNPYTGRTLLQAPRPSSSGVDSVHGGILCDEMGLGKTVELLACIMAHRYRGAQQTATGHQHPLEGEEGALPDQAGSEPQSDSDYDSDDSRVQQVGHKRRRAAGRRQGSVGSAAQQRLHGTGQAGKRRRGPVPGAVEHIHCICGFYREDPDDDGDHDGVWIQCDVCLAWMHGECVGVRRATHRGQYACSRCLRSTALQRVEGPCGATLVVCPAPILQQWWQEIHKHVQPGQVKVVVYLGQQQGGANRALGVHRWAAPAVEAGQTADNPDSGSSAYDLVISAADLAAADIVLTTYDALKKDVDRQPGEADVKNLRRQKRYHVIPTPLTRLTWWRVVLDEAQMVESSTAKATEMARRLSAVHRWCVTGTPISRGLEDVFGLLSFLRVQPWSSHYWWSRAIQRPVDSGCSHAMARLLCALKPSLGGLMWRTAKRDVVAELGIPPQHHHLTWLYHSPVERHFYIRQHQECASKVRQVLPSSLLSAVSQHTTANITNNHDAPTNHDRIDVARPAPADATNPQPSTTPTNGPSDAPEQGGPSDSHRHEQAAGGGNTHTSRNGHPRRAKGHNDSNVNRALTQVEQKKVLLPLLRLRQAACHPQVGAGGIKAVTAQRAPMTMDEILGVLTTKAKYEAEEAQRALIHALNGLAALMLLERGDAGRADAVAAYREAMRAMEKNKKDIDTDPLQQLHTFHNLAQLLATNIPGVGRTLRDDQLTEDADKIRTKYLEQRTNQLAAQQADYDKALKAAQPFDHHQGWFLTAFEMITTYYAQQGSHTEQDLVAAIREKLLDDDTRRLRTNINASNMGNRFRTLRQLQVLLVDALSNMEAARAQALDKLKELIVATQTASPEFVEQAGHCQRCRADLHRQGRVCDHCSHEELLVKWEVQLFSIYTRALAAGQQVSGEDAARRAAANMLRRVNQGGLGEGQDAEGGDLVSAGNEVSRRDNEAVAAAQILWKPSDVEQVLKMLHSRLSQVSAPAVAAGVLDKGQVAEVLGQAKAHLERLAAQRKLFAQARQLTLAQRWLLYAHDELDMAVARTRLRLPGEWVPAEEEAFRIFPEEIPIRNKDLSNDKLVAEGDLVRTLGTLRYLRSLQAARRQEDAETARAAQQEGAQAAGDGPAQPGSPRGQSEQTVTPQAPQNAVLGSSAQSDAGAASQVVQLGARPGAAGPTGAAEGGKAPAQEICPVCHDPIATQFSMLPCGHMTCNDCMAMLVGHVPTNVPAAQRKVSCPTCRTRVLITEVSQVDGGGTTRTATQPASTLRSLTVQLPASDAATATWLPLPPAPPTSTMQGAAVPHPGVPGQDPGRSSAAQHLSEQPRATEMVSMWAGEGDVVVSGSYGTKVEAVVRRILHILKTDDSAKVVVFSSWLDLLELMAHALNTNRVAYAFAKAKQGFHAALAAFKGQMAGPAQPSAATAEPADGGAAEGAGGDDQGGDDQEDAQPAKKRVMWAVSDSSESEARVDGEAAVQEGEEGFKGPQCDSEFGGGVMDEAGIDTSGQVQQPVTASMAHGSERWAHAAERKASADPAAVSHSPRARSQRVDSPAVGERGSRAGGSRKRGRGRGRQQGVSSQQAMHSAALQANPRVLLLLMSQGGAGLNLIEAQHVILIEPHTDPASELQAVGRVHRIGQTRETHVHRFIVHHTVEENVLALGAGRAQAMDMGHGAGAVAGGGRQGAAKEGLSTVADVALLLTTPWSAAESAMPPELLEAGALGRRDEGGREQAVDAGVEGVGVDDVPAGGAGGHTVGNGGGGAGEDGEALPRSARETVASAAEMRWRLQQQGGEDGS